MLILRVDPRCGAVNPRSRGCSAYRLGRTFAPPMSTKRDVLAHLTRDELLAVVDRFALAVPDRHAKEGLIEAVAAAKKSGRRGDAPAEPGHPPFKTYSSLCLDHHSRQ